MMPKMSGYVKTFKVKVGDKDKNTKLMSFHIVDEELLEKYKAIWTMTEDLKSIELNSLLVNDDRYIKTKIRTYDDKVYTKFRGLNVSQKMIWNVNVLQSILLILCLYTTRNINCKYIVLIKL